MTAVLGIPQPDEGARLGRVRPLFALAAELAQAVIGIGQPGNNRQQRPSWLVRDESVPGPIPSGDRELAMVS